MNTKNRDSFFSIPQVKTFISIVMFLNIILSIFHMIHAKLFSKSTQDVFIISMAFIAMIATFVLYMSVVFDKIRNQKHVTLFLINLVCLYIVLSNDMLTLLHSGQTNIFFKYFIDSSVYFFDYILLLVFKIYLNHKVKTERLWYKINNIVYYVFIGFCLFLLVTNPFTKLLFYYDETGMYVCSILFRFLAFSILYAMIMNTVLMIIYSNEPKFKKLSLFAATLFSVIPIAFLFNRYSISLLEIGLFIILLIIYSNVQYEESLELKKMQSELVEANDNVMLSQIQPHFLYNSLATISALCDIDPSLAQNGINRFSDYLRMNLYTIKCKDNIPFTKELEHIQTYLWLEQMRFENRLKVVYDTEFVDFEIPPLIIQPIVENAVKHGILKKPEGGTITISSKIKDENYEISIKDDGVGFNLNDAPEGNGVHIGMDNVKERLDKICHGKMIIESELGKGTTVTVLIPEKQI